jgi:tetraacyldisaccharide 4'-kinase
VSRERYFRDLLEGKRNTAGDRLLVGALSPFSLFYRAAVSLRARAYAGGLLSVRRLDRPVISVGNLTAGGTGKTPVAALVAQMLMDSGHRVALLSRGYGGTREGSPALVSDGTRIFLSAAEAGDEPVLLCRRLPGLMAAVGADRFQAGLLLRESLDPDVFILDDGFQHLGLYRDLNILLLDCRRPFGNGKLLPAGLLREPPAAAARADLVIFTRCAEQPPASLGGIPACGASHRLAASVSTPSGEEPRLDALKGKRALAFAGIADPGGFFSLLREEGIDLAATLPLRDHERYTQPVLDSIRKTAQSSGAEIFITTEKDAVKLSPDDLPLPLCVAPLDLRLHDSEPLSTALRKLLR